MWKRLEIDGNSLFIECKIAKKFVKFILYDLKRSWCEYIELSNVLKRAKELNKRIQFDELTIQSTLLAAEAEDAQFEGGNRVEDQTLKLKYRINSLPFHFKWQLKEQTELEFREIFTIPIFMALHGMSSQIEELRNVISKKDVELKQYRDEGAILRRTTVATQPFDFGQFDDKFAAINKVTKGFQKVVDSIMEQIKVEQENASEEPKETDSVSTTKEQTNEKSKTFQNEKTKKASPISRKRKNNDLQEKRMEMKLKASKQKIEYESSQSLTESSADLDIVSQELVAIQNSLRDLEKQRIADLNRLDDVFRFE